MKCYCSVFKYSPLKFMWQINSYSHYSLNYLSKYFFFINCKGNYIKHHKTTALFMQHMKQICNSLKASVQQIEQLSEEGPQGSTVFFIFYTMRICLQEVDFDLIFHTDFALTVLLLFNQPAKYLQCSDRSTRHHISPIASKFFLNFLRMICSPLKWIIDELFGSSDIFHASVLICWMQALF